MTHRIAPRCRCTLSSRGPSFPPARYLIVSLLPLILGFLISSFLRSLSLYEPVEKLNKLKFKNLEEYIALRILEKQITDLEVQIMLMDPS
jgi:hypothetical protein